MRAMVVALASLLAAGCLGSPSAPDASHGSLGETPADASPAAGDANNTTLPTLGPPVNPWLEGETERVLFAGSVEAGDCYVGSFVYEPVFGQYVYGGCAIIFLPEGAIVPEGTRALRVEGDATDALRSGKYFAYLYTALRRTPSEANGELSANPVHTWNFPLAPAEWDGPWRTESSIGVGFWTEGDNDAPLLVGTIDTRVVVERDLNWTPEPRLDHFRIPGLHRMPQPGVITLLDANVTILDPSPISSTPREDVPDLEDALVEGTRQLAVGFVWDAIQGCPDVFECTLRGNLRTPEGPVFPADAAAGEQGQRWQVWVFDVPDPVPPDGPRANTSASGLHLTVTEDAGDGGDCSCSPQDVSAPTRIVVEAWNATVDLAVFKARLGVA